MDFSYDIEQIKNNISGLKESNNILEEKTNIITSHQNTINERIESINRILSGIQIDIDIKKIQKPFLKWLGGKTQIINQVIKKIPVCFNNYHELFLGGGSVLFATLSMIKYNNIKILGKIYAYDINNDLINVYKQIQNNKDSVFEFIQRYITEYDRCEQLKTKSDVNRNPLTIEEATAFKENYYYWMRKKFNNNNIKNTSEHAALFIVINKTTFRGMYREGPNGFNVPYGNYKTTPTMMNKEELNNISELIKDVEFKCCNFEESFKNIQKNDYVYLDPPYAPENDTSFVGYNASGFNKEQHIKLFKIIKDTFGKNKCKKFCMSNANVKFVTDAFKDYNIDYINCKRSINSKKPQSTTTEVLITEINVIT